MPNRIPLVAFVGLGQNLWFLLNPQTANVQAYFTGIRDFMEQLAQCNLPRTAHAASTLAGTKTIYHDPRTQLITQSGVTYFQAMMAPIRDCLFAEASALELLAVKNGTVSQQLRTLPAGRALNDTQHRLLEETILCLEAGANRAAVVMGWNLAYDVIRQWVFDNHLQDFNAALAKHVDRKNGDPIYSPIANYEDFFTGKLGEYAVIDTCFAAQKISGKLRDNLQQHLRRRNDYAHRSFTAPTPEQAAAFIQEMIDIMTCPPFV
jgi:hypothetical protein